VVRVGLLYIDYDHIHIGYFASIMSEFIYHEKQAAALCGVHCLNNLLQGPYLNAGVLADIAHELDAAERKLMFSQGMNTPEAIRYAASDSVNVDASGNFSITVLTKALKNSHNLSLVRRQSNDSSDPSTANGFVCNLEAHWFALRPIFGVWWNLNSMLPKPSKVGDVYLGAYLAQLSLQGYSIFEVKGGCPPPATVGGSRGLRVPSFGAETSWHSVTELMSGSSSSGNGNSSFPGVGKSLNDSGDGGGDEDEQMRLAIAASLASSGGGGGHGGDMDPGLAQALAMSRGDVMEEEDDDLQRALAMSLNTVVDGSNGEFNSSTDDADERRRKMVEAAEKRFAKK
jgi:ataxin-3